MCLSILEWENKSEKEGDIELNRGRERDKERMRKKYKGYIGKRERGQSTIYVLGSKKR